METIKAVKEFRGLSDSRTDYERAVRDLPYLRGALIEPFKAILHSMPEFKAERMAEDTAHSKIHMGGCAVELQAERRIANPPYKGIVEVWENYLKGISFLTRSRAITGVLKHDEGNYLEAGRLCDDFCVLADGALEETVEVNIKGADGVEEAGEIVIPEKIRLDSECLSAYLNGLRIEAGLSGLIDSYTKAVHREAKLEGTPEVAVTQKVAYVAKSSRRARLNWAGVVKTMITMPTERRRKDKGELEMLADEDFGIADRIEMFGLVYDLVEHETRDGYRLYVGVQSVGQRIACLKENKTKTNVRSAKHQEVV